MMTLGAAAISSRKAACASAPRMWKGTWLTRRHRGGDRPGNRPAALAPRGFHRAACSLPGLGPAATGAVGGGGGGRGRGGRQMPTGAHLLLLLLLLLLVAGGFKIPRGFKKVLLRFKSPEV